MTTYHHYTHYPAGYETDIDRRWPLHITLHGAGERNVALEALQHHHYYLPMYELTSAQYPMLVVVPHCPPRQYWMPEKMENLVVKLLATERINPNRIYLSGFSMGGYGAWQSAMEYPDRYAAIAPVCGGGDPSWAARIRNLPIWAFHSAQNPLVPMEETNRMVDTVITAGIRVRQLYCATTSVT